MLRTTVILIALLTLSGASLPEQGPLPQARDGKAVAVPEEKPDDKGKAETAGEKSGTADDKKPADGSKDLTGAGRTDETSKPDDTPIPEEKPVLEEKPPSDNKTATEEKPVPEDKPVPEEKPVPGDKPVTDQTGAKAEPEPKLVVEKEDPAVYAACIVALKAAGAVFKEEQAIDDGDGCGIDKPLSVTSIGGGIKLEPDGQMRCETALRLSEWAEKSVEPAAQTAFGEKARLTGIGQASTYICRLRNNAETGKISEHARGNAVDIATLTFEGAPPVEMKPRLEDSTMTGAFQRAVTATACLYFSTVLSPGSDAAHETHLHMDVLKREGDYRYCR